MEGGSSTLFQLLKSLENEAKLGATKLFINGINIAETRLMNPAAAQRFGYVYEQVTENSIRLIKQLQ